MDTNQDDVRLKLLFLRWKLGKDLTSDGWPPFRKSKRITRHRVVWIVERRGESVNHSKPDSNTASETGRDESSDRIYLLQAIALLTIRECDADI
jgi:ABC-type Fe2+-enterobactin transport system substrate-binding protein